ncbi:hypothetical protein B0H11DRAFT_2421164 [Mycena galericulata]|nr:hypothetical protein B0H11DRAFT_2421164 [Mycena galericulata]
MIPSGPGTYPRLPRELERAIFETSAISRPVTILTLILVAQRVKIWKITISSSWLYRVEPILYRIVYLWEGEALAVEGFPRFTFKTFLQAIEQKPPEFFNCAVRHLFLGEPEAGRPSSELHARTIDSILNVCTGITTLFAWTAFPNNLPALNALDSLHRLAFSIVELFGPNPTGCFAQPLFRNITHLEMLDSIPAFTCSHAASLSLIPHLTHFAFGDCRLCSGFCGAFRLCARLTCIVLLEAESMGDVDVEADSLLEDTRFVAISEDNFRVDWARGVFRGRDYWVLADAFLAARRAGKVDRSHYYIHDDDESWFDMA